MRISFGYHLFKASQNCKGSLLDTDRLIPPESDVAYSKKKGKEIAYEMYVTMRRSFSLYSSSHLLLVIDVRRSLVQTLLIPDSGIIFLSSTLPPPSAISLISNKETKLQKENLFHHLKSHSTCQLSQKRKHLRRENLYR